MAANQQEDEPVWVTKFLEKNPSAISSAVVKEVWDNYDSEAKGFINEEQASKFLSDLAGREQVTLEEDALKALIKECSVEGKFTFAAFKHLVAEWAALNEFDLSVSMQQELETKEEEDPTFTGVRMSGFKRFDWNRKWKKDETERDGFPVYSNKAYKRTFYLYYRAQEKRWVIDDLLVDEGPYFACHSEGPSFSEGVWHTACSWTVSPDLKVNKVEDDKGHQNEAVDVVGAPEGTAGVYLRVADDINGKPHYAKTGPPARHLFYTERERVYQISPCASEEKGAYSISVSFNGPWMVIPEDREEKSVNIRTFENGEEK